MLRQSGKTASQPMGGRGIHYAWFIAAMAAVLQVTTNFISQAFSVIMVTIQKDFGWTLTAITMAYFIKNIVQAVSSPLAGWLGDRYGARRALLVAATVYAAGMLLLSRMQQIWQLYLYYSVMLGLAQAMFSVNIPTTVAAWFRQRLGLAIGVQQSLGGMGASVMAPLLALVLARTDWQSAFVGITIVGSIILFTLLLLFHNDPADNGMKAYGARATGQRQPSVMYSPDVTKVRTQVFLQHVRRTWAFWNLIAIHHLGCIGHSIIMVGVVYYATMRGVSLPQAAWIVSIYSLCGVASRFATPILADRWGAKGVMALAFFLQGITVALLFWTQEVWQFYVFAALFGIGLGGEMSAFIVINRQYYGVGPVRTVFGFQQFGASLGMALGGLIGSVIFDTFGSYDIAWLISIVASLGGVVCILLLEPTSRLLISDWEASLPPEARSSVPTRLA
jgi:MFS family permease